MVGAAGFELATPCTPCKCATRLRYAPTQSAHSIVHTLFFQELTIYCFALFIPENLDAQGLEILDGLVNELRQTSVFFLLASEACRQIRHPCSAFATDGGKLGVLIGQAILKTILLCADGFLKVF